MRGHEAAAGGGGEGGQRLQVGAASQARAQCKTHGVFARLQGVQCRVAGWSAGILHRAGSCSLLFLLNSLYQCCCCYCRCCPPRRSSAGKLSIIPKAELRAQLEGAKAVEDVSRAAEAFLTAIKEGRQAAALAC